MRSLLVVVALMTAACTPGPPPAPPPLIDPKEDRYPSTGDDPLPLHDAVYKGDIAAIRSLLDAGADPNARWGDRGDNFPLAELFFTHRPVAMSLERRMEIAQLLLSRGADPNARWCPFESRYQTRADGTAAPGCLSAKGSTLLIQASVLDHARLVEWLLRQGADPTLRDWNGASAIDYATTRAVFDRLAQALFPEPLGRQARTLAVLDEFAGASWRPATPWNATVLSRALTMDYGPVEPQPPVTDGMILISHRGDRDRVVDRMESVLSYGADPNQRVSWGGADWTPLALAITTRRPRAVELLLERGADPNGRWCVRVDAKPTTASRQADPRCTAATGTTPLMWAAEVGLPIDLSQLLAHGADRTQTDWAGRIAIDFAPSREARRILSAPSQ